MLHKTWKYIPQDESEDLQCRLLLSITPTNSASLHYFDDYFTGFLLSAATPLLSSLPAAAMRPLSQASEISQVSQLSQLSRLSHSIEPAIGDSYANLFIPVVDEKIDRRNGVDEVTLSLEDDPSLNLPPADGGRQAWLYMFGAFMVEGLLWGFPLTFGVFQTYYQANPPFKGNEYIPIVGTLCTGVAYLGTPLVTPFTIKYPVYQRHMIWVGFSLCIASLVASSFATQLWHLIVTQGVLYGIGFLLIYYPLLSMLNEWFIERRGLAYGIMFGSAGVCGLGLPFLVHKMLSLYGYAITLRGFAVLLCILVGPTIPLLQPRIPPKNHEKIVIDTSVFKKPLYIVITISNIFQGIGFFLPALFISSYASSMGIPEFWGTLILSLMNLSQVFGQISMGFLCDRLPSQIPMLSSSILSCIVCVFVWGFAKSPASLVAFGILYGLSAGGYSVLYCRFVTLLTDDTATGLWLYSLFEFQRGIGNIIGGLVSGFLVKGQLSKGEYGIGKYPNLILFVGAAFLLSSIIGAPACFIRGERHKIGGMIEKWKKSAVSLMLP